MKSTTKSIAAMLLLLGGSMSLSAAESLFKNIDNERNTAQSTQANLPGEVASNRVQLNAGVLTQSTQQIKIDLRKGLSLTVDKHSAQTNAQGSLVWHGKKSSQGTLSNRQSQLSNDAVLVKRASGITGSVRIDGKLFKIRPLANGIHEIIEVNEADMPMEHPPGEMQVLEQTANESAMINSLNLDAAIAPQASANAPDIKILVAYTAAANAQVSDMQGLIELAVAETNTGYTNSAVDATVTLVHTYQVSYTESNFSTDLAYFRNDNDGVMDEVHGKRDQYGADIAVIITNVSDYCGLASAIGASSSTAFAAVYHGCATGYYSFGHELGHLQSARHNPEADPTNSPYAFGHGYQYTSGGWRTVMAYNCSPSCTRINWWSNPNKTRNGVAMGTSSRHDNARVLNLTAATMAGFKGGGTNPPGDNELTNGVTVSNLSGAKDAQIRYTMDVPAAANSLSFVINGGSGDADLYVKFGSAPTTGSYDCRPWKNGNNETCTISNIQAGTYHVMLNGYSSFSGVSLTGTYTEGSSGGSFENTNNYSIPDNNSTGISSPISVSRSGASGTVSVEVNIVHTYKGDLIVDLIHPDGTVYNLHNRSGGGANNINQTYSVNVGSKDSAGTWNLRVRDLANIDTGNIDSWKITF
ncbi:proprotein convertase P-domain-containing protein [Aliikangiella coralliicola]|uniref:MAM protein n=1 Tax=Aliikangiella coralliicola TaxID=2592383 RepID=A0A545UH11_9GAMM|nr:proprotein convertase P-domain-containing protein [Aliikangiella coralliicola]TQV88752.1 MAM protein [Aliikangiella coralliicola]